MIDAPAFDFYPERWTHGTRGMTKIERCDFLDLLCFQWTDDGLPVADVDLARLCGYTRTQTIADRVISKFPVAIDGKRRNARLEEIRENQRLRITRSREKVDKMNAAMAKKRHLQDHLQGEQKRILTASSPLTTHHSPKKDTASQYQACAKIPVLAEWQEFAKTLTPSWPASESERAWLHYDSNGWNVGKNPVKKWEACCRKCHLNWKTQTYSPNGTPNSRNHPGSTFEAFRNAPPVEPTSGKNGLLFPVVRDGGPKLDP